MLQTAVIIGHVFLAAALILLILLQHGKGADAGAAFGAGASGTVFGARGSASFLSRATAVLASMFFVTSLSLAYLGGKQSVTTDSVLETLADPQSADDDSVELMPLPDGDRATELPALPLPGTEVPAESVAPDGDGN